MALNCPGVTLYPGIKLLGKSAMTFSLCGQDQTAVLHFRLPGSGSSLSYWITDSRVGDQQPQCSDSGFKNSCNTAANRTHCVKLEAIKVWRKSCSSLMVNTVKTARRLMV